MPAPRCAPLLGRNRDFTLLWSGQAVSALGSRTSMITYPLLVLAVTGSAGLVGVVMAVSMIVQLLVGLPGGAIVDRVDKRRLMIACDIARLVAQGSVAAALVTDRLGIGLIVGAIAVESGFSAVFGAAEPAAVRHVVRPDDRSLALARNEARSAAAMLAGPPLGGLLFAITPALPFLADAVSYLVSFACIALIRSPMQRPPESERQTLRQALPYGLKWVWGQPFLRVTMLLISGSNLVSNAVLLVAIVVSQRRGDADLTTGVLVTIMAVGMLVGAIAAPRVVTRLPVRAILVLNRAVWTAAIPLMLLAPNSYVIGGLIAVMMILGPSGNTAITTSQMRLTPEHLQGRVSSASGFCAGAAAPVGAVLVGYGLENANLAVTVAALAGWMLLMTAIASLSRAIRTPDHSFRRSETSAP